MQVEKLLINISTRFLISNGFHPYLTHFPSLSFLQWNVLVVFSPSLCSCSPLSLSFLLFISLIPYSELGFNRSRPFFRLRTMCYTHPLSPASPFLSSLAPDYSFPFLSLFLLHSPLLSLAFCLFSPNFHASPPCILIVFHFHCRPLGSFNIFQLHLQCVCVCARACVCVCVCVCVCLWILCLLWMSVYAWESVNMLSFMEMYKIKYEKCNFLHDFCTDFGVKP